MTINYTGDQYVEDVLAGRQVACYWVKLACERHVQDLSTGEERGLWFDEQAARRACAFFPLMLRHSKGKWARTPLYLESWQQFVIGSLFGWKRGDGTRRFRTGYLEVGRKNGKSVLVSGVGLYLLTVDNEPGAEVYTAATKLDQARIVHQEAIRMVKQSPLLSQELNVNKNNIHSVETFSKFEPLGSDSKTLDGLNVHAGLVDEVHAHPDAGVWDVLQTGMGARTQPLMIGITTAGFNRNSFGYSLHDYSEKVLDGTFVDDSWFAAIYTLDRDPETGQVEDWENEDAWVKANPNLGVSKFVDVLRDGARRAKAQASAVNNFLTKELNVWTTATERAINMEKWKLCSFGAVDIESLYGRKCWMGVDLSTTTDMTASVLVFEADDDGVRPVVCRFWMPEDNVFDRVKSDRVPLDAWARGGYVDLTPGNVLDDAYILAQIKSDFTLFDVQEVAFDPWNATWLANQLQAAGMDEKRLVAFRQGYVSMNPAMDQLEKAIGRREFNHQGNPVLAWMASNLVFARDPAGNKKPDKSKSSERIDGMVAFGMALYRSALAVDIASVYESRGVVQI